MKVAIVLGGSFRNNMGDKNGWVNHFGPKIAADLRMVYLWRAVDAEGEVPRIRKHAFTSGRLALFGIRRALHRKAAGGAVILAFIEEIRRRNKSSSLKHVEFGWVLEDNLGMRRPIELSGARIDKVHRVYEKNLAA